MSNYYKEYGERFYPDFGPGRTKQAFKDDCDVNKILAKAQKVGSLSHLQRHGAVYGDFTEVPGDLLEAQKLLERGQEIFSELPSEVRKEFRHDATAFFKFVNDPENRERLPELLPEIAKPGRFFPDVSAASPPGALKSAPSAEGASPGTSVPEKAPEPPLGSEGE